MPSDPGYGTDSGNSHHFVTKHEGDILYAPGLGWLLWDGSRYAFDEKNNIMRKVREFGHQLALDSTDDREMKIASASQSMRSISAIIKLAESDCRAVVTGKELDTATEFLNVRNAEIDLRTQTAHYGHRQGSRFTKLVDIDYEWDTGCPFWDEFLKLITGGDQDMIDFLQRAAGYSLTGDVSARKMFIAYGDGLNGKTTFLETLSLLAGEYGCNMPADYLMERKPGAATNDIARLRGRRYAYSSEFPENTKLDQARVKEMTGGDTLTARFLHKEFFQFNPTHKSWIATNHRPVISGEDPAMVDRMIIVPFDVRIPEDKLLDKTEVEARIRAELPGILRWAVEGAAMWFENGLPLPTKVEAAILDYKYDMDRTGKFIESSCVWGEGLSVGALDLYQAYRGYCKRNGDKPVSHTVFGLNLKKKKSFANKTRAGITGSWVYHGVGLSNESTSGGPLAELMNSVRFLN